jgi:hypothetical protein
VVGFRFLAVKLIFSLQGCGGGDLREKLKRLHWYNGLNILFLVGLRG